MPPRHIALAVLVAAVYGTAFVAIQLAVDEMPPLLVTGYRFLFAAIPLVFFVRPPKVGIGYLVSYGVMQGAIMFGLIFTAIKWGMQPGLASLVVQLQVFFTVLFSAAVFGERPRRREIVGSLIAFAGIVIIGSGLAQSAPMLPFFMVIASAAAWGCANVIAKAAKPDTMLGFVGWTSLAAPLPLFLASMAFEGTRFGLPDVAPDLTGILSVAYLAYPTTVFAFAAWIFLLRQHPAAVVTPFALLIPVFGMASTAIVFQEWLTVSTSIGAAFVLVGLAINVFGLPFGRRAVIK